MGVRASDDLLLEPANELARMLRERELSAVELLDLHVARIEARNRELGALVLPRLDAARAEGVVADGALASGAPVGPLHGIPFTAKDAIAVAGVRRPERLAPIADDVPGYDAPAVRRMRDAGGILLGKTNVPEFCGFYDTVNDVFGATRNPHAPDRSAGGSSGGEAAAVASGMSALGVGSDLASSIRNPAHFTGAFGLKPSRELVPCVGHAPAGETPLWWRLAVIGPLARSANDLELALAVLAEHTPAAPRPGAGTVGVYDEDFLQPVAGDCRRAVRLAAEALATAGYDSSRIARPASRRSANCSIGWSVSSLSLRSLRWRRGERTSCRATGAWRSSPPPMKRCRSGTTSRRGRSSRPSSARSTSGSSGEGWRSAPSPRARHRSSERGFTEIDGEPVRPGGKLTLCTLANAVGLPAAAVPALRTVDGLPVGAQVIGGRGRDREVIAAARTIEEACGDFIAP